MPCVIGCKKDPIKETAEGLVDSYEGSKMAAARATLKSMQDAVRAYHAENNTYPGTLEEVAGLMSSSVDTDQYEYDPSTGQVSLRNDR